MLHPHDLAKHSEHDYLETFSGLYEHAPWVAQRAFQATYADYKYNNLNAFHQLLSKTMLSADSDKQDRLILAHPMLAGKKMLDQTLTKNSTLEQKTAGLNTCSDKEIDQFNTLNEDYFKKHAFPFILAVMGRSKLEIIKIFKKRINNTTLDEREQALKEINTIAKLRLQQIYNPSNSTL